MKCKEAYVCLLNATRADELPPELIQHLFRCGKCQQRQQRLLRLEHEIREMPRPGESPNARADFLARLEPRPERPVSVVASAESGWSMASWRWRASIFATAASILLIFGLVMGWAISSLLSRQGPTPVAGAVQAGPAETVVSRVLEKHLRLAETSATSDQLSLLADMAADLRTEALRLAKEGPVEDVLLVSSLYERLVCQGVVGRAKTLPAEQADMVASLVSQLEQTARDSDRAASEALPGAAEGLRTLASAALAASQSLTGQAAAPELRSPSWQPARSGTMRDLLGVLVLQGILLAEETDPLRRAEHCNEVAEHFAQGILLASSGGDTDRATKLGGFLGSIMDRGVASNLDRYQPAGPEDIRMAEIKNIGERSTRTVALLEEKLEKAPAAAQPGLEMALEASRGHPGKGKKSSKGLPPGLQKALEKGKPLPPNMQKRLP